MNSHTADKRKHSAEFLNDPGNDDGFLNEYLESQETASHKKPKLQPSSPQAKQEIQQKNAVATKKKEGEEREKPIVISLKLKPAPKDGQDITKKKQTTEPSKENQPIPSTTPLKPQMKDNVINDSRLETIPKDIKERFLGHIVYTGAHHMQPNSTDFETLTLFLLPRFTSADHYATMQVRIPAEFLSFKTNLAVRARAVWGSLVYTDDSDIVAAILHSGMYKTLDQPLDKELGQETVPVHPQLPDHDLHVTIRILPRLIRYQGSWRHGISSRSWGSLHDGESFKIESITKVERGTVVKQGRKVGSKAWVDLAGTIKEDDDQALLIRKDGEGWYKYTLKTMKEHQNWEEKLKSHALMLETGQSEQRLTLTKKSKYQLAEKGEKLRECDSIQWTESGLRFADQNFKVDRFAWKNI